MTFTEEQPNAKFLGTFNSLLNTGMELTAGRLAIAGWQSWQKHLSTCFAALIQGWAVCSFDVY